MAKTGKWFLGAALCISFLIVLVLFITGCGSKGRVGTDTGEECLNKYGAFFGIPGNKVFLKEYMDCLKIDGGMGGHTQPDFWKEENPDIYVQEPLSDEETGKFYKLIEEAEATDSRNKLIFSIIEEEAEGYFAGQKSLDEVIKVIQSRVSLYLNERR